MVVPRLLDPVEKRFTNKHHFGLFTLKLLDVRGDIDDVDVVHSLGRAWGITWKSKANFHISLPWEVNSHLHPLTMPWLRTNGVLLDARDDAIREYKLTAFHMGVLHDRHIGPGLMPVDLLPEGQEEDERQLFTFHGMNTELDFQAGMQCL